MPHSRMSGTNEQSIRGQRRDNTVGQPTGLIKTLSVQRACNSPSSQHPTSNSRFQVPNHTVNLCTTHTYVFAVDPPQSRPQPPARSYTATTTDGAKLTARTGSGASGNGLSPVAASTGGGISSPSPHPWRAGHHRTRPVSAAPALQQVAPPQSRAAGEAFR